MNYIIHPITGDKHLLHSKDGLNVLRNYIKVYQSGGSGTKVVQGKRKRPDGRGRGRGRGGLGRLGGRGKSADARSKSRLQELIGPTTPTGHRDLWESFPSIYKSKDLPPISENHNNDSRSTPLSTIFPTSGASRVQGRRVDRVQMRGREVNNQLLLTRQNAMVGEVGFAIANAIDREDLYTSPIYVTLQNYLVNSIYTGFALQRIDRGGGVSGAQGGGSLDAGEAMPLTPEEEGADAGEADAGEADAGTGERIAKYRFNDVSTPSEIECILVDNIHDFGGKRGGPHIRNMILSSWGEIGDILNQGGEGSPGKDIIDAIHNIRLQNQFGHIECVLDNKLKVPPEYVHWIPLPSKKTLQRTFRTRPVVQMIARYSQSEELNEAYKPTILDISGKRADSAKIAGRLGGVGFPMEYANSCIGKNDAAGGGGSPIDCPSPLGGEVPNVFPYKAKGEFALRDMPITDQERLGPFQNYGLADNGVGIPPYYLASSPNEAIACGFWKRVRDGGGGIIYEKPEVILSTGVGLPTLIAIVEKISSFITSQNLPTPADLNNDLTRDINATQWTGPGYMLYKNIHDVLTTSDPPYCRDENRKSMAIVMLALYKYYGDGLQRYLSVYLNKAFWSGDTFCCKIQMKNTELGANPVTLGTPGKTTLKTHYLDQNEAPYDNRDDVFFTLCCPPKPVIRDELIENVKNQLLESVYGNSVDPYNIELTPLVGESISLETPGFADAFEKLIKAAILFQINKLQEHINKLENTSDGGLFATRDAVSYVLQKIAYINTILGLKGLFKLITKKRGIKKSIHKKIEIIREIWDNKIKEQLLMKIKEELQQRQQLQRQQLQRQQLQRQQLQSENEIQLCENLINEVKIITEEDNAPNNRRIMDFLEKSGKLLKRNRGVRGANRQMIIGGKSVGERIKDINSYYEIEGLLRGAETLINEMLVPLGTNGRIDISPTISPTISIILKQSEGSAVGGVANQSIINDQKTIYEAARNEWTKITQLFGIFV